MENAGIITTIITTLLGGGVGAFLTYKLGNRKQDETEFTSLVSAYKDLVQETKDNAEELKMRVDALEQQVKGLNKAVSNKDKEIQHLRNQLIIFESSHADVPVPIWLKDTNGIMLFLNSEYENKILRPINKTSEDYIGETDFKIYPPNIAKEFRKHDRRVLTQKKPIRFKERWQGSDGQWLEGDIIKYPRFLNRNTVIGIGGLIIDIKEIDDEDIN
jgi:PAS domain-containing protein